MRQICLDTETTGLDPLPSKGGHRIIEIACIEMVNLVKTGKHFHCYINPERAVPQEAFAIHNISTEFLQDKPIFKEIANDFLLFIQNSPIIIHNASFDLKFLNFELENIGLKHLFNNQIIDSLAIAREKFPGSPNSLDALCKRFNINNNKRTYHGALIDTELLCDIYVELMGGIQNSLVLENGQNSQNSNNIGQNSHNNSLQTSNFATIPYRPQFKISTQEEENHKNYITKNFKTNLWGY